MPDVRLFGYAVEVDGDSRFVNRQGQEVSHPVPMAPGAASARANQTPGAAVVEVWVKRDVQRSGDHYAQRILPSDFIQMLDEMPNLDAEEVSRPDLRAWRLRRREMLERIGARSELG